ncbi:hypothetical protein niasHT_019729 [Heterodera trifolii]|uniref:Uncharacterized protein n=1 Tax=Heterodera trifolii TaxID=157864 RepID=A0ABD2LC13_9BILA
MGPAGPTEAAGEEEAEDRLRKLLSSIGQLSEHGEVPAYAFATLISSAPPQAIAEHLHQRWLSDSHFAKITPKIIAHMSTNVKVYSQVLALVLRDYNFRHEIRAQSRGMFRNYVRTLTELYPVYRQIDKSLSACLVDPLFRCLQMLSEEGPDDSDMLCFGTLFAEFGHKLQQLNPSECDRMVLACRFWLCSNQLALEEKTRRHLMKAIDLWTYSWDPKLFPDCLRRHYSETEAETKGKCRCMERQNSSGESPFTKYQQHFLRSKLSESPSLSLPPNGTMPMAMPNSNSHQPNFIPKEANHAQTLSSLAKNGHVKEKAKSERKKGTTERVPKGEKESTI